VTRRLTDQLLDASIEAARLAAVDQAATLRFGVVTAVDGATKTLTCTVSGMTLRKVPYMRSYTTPAVSDVVWLLHQGSTVIALGEF
jgi:putative N-acetylmannosamine-6-phosphate epimerase